MQTTREMQNGCPNQASGYEMANKPKIKKERTHAEKEREKKREKTKQHFLKRKRRQVISASNGTKAGCTKSVYTIQPT